MRQKLPAPDEVKGKKLFTPGLVILLAVIAFAVFLLVKYIPGAPEEPEASPSSAPPPTALEYDEAIWRRAEPLLALHKSISVTVSLYSASRLNTEETILFCQDSIEYYNKAEEYFQEVVTIMDGEGTEYTDAVLNYLNLSRQAVTYFQTGVESGELVTGELEELIAYNTSLLEVIRQKRIDFLTEGETPAEELEGIQVAMNAAIASAR